MIPNRFRRKMNRLIGKTIIQFSPPRSGSTLNKLPDEIVHRSKMGLTFPFDLWMRNELKGFIEERLNYSSVFKKPYITKLLDGFYNHKVHWSRVWGLLVLSQWIK